MKIININTFDGPNIYSHKKCIRLDLDLEGFSEVKSSDIEGFNDKLIELVPELKKHCCALGYEGGFLDRLKEGTYLAHICEHTTIALQNRFGIDVKYGKAREIKGDLYYIVYQHYLDDFGLECGRVAVKIINFLIYKNTFSIENELNKLEIMCNKESFGISTQAIYNEAIKRKIPVIRLGDGSFLQLGYGKYSEIVEATIGSTTKAVAVDIACDKLLTKEILRSQCIPVPMGGLATNKENLLIQVEDIGYPVVLKPRYGNQGRGVIVNIENEKDLIYAYNTLSIEYKDIIVEKYVRGRDFRVCIVGDKVVAVSLRIPPAIIGNGINSIEELIRIINKDIKRGEDHEKILTKIIIDQELVSLIIKKGYELNAILPKGKKLFLRNKANLSTGGTAIDCTQEISEENIKTCLRAAKTIGLDICGIDICCKDISRPLKGTDSIIEINAAPGIRMHHFPSIGSSHNVAGAILEFIYKEKTKSIPIVSITGTNGKTTTTRLIGYALKLAGYKIGMTTTGGIYVGDDCIKEGDTTGPKSAKTILTNKEVEAAVLETARGGIIRNGLGYNLADVAVITNITEDHLGLDGIDTIEQLAMVKSLVAEAVKDEGVVVLNAADPVSLSIIPRIKCKTMFFSISGSNERLKENIRTGSTCIYAEGKYVILESIKGKYPLMSIKDIGITLEGKLSYNVENAMAAALALVALAVDKKIIIEALTSFKLDGKQNPGRFNMYDLDKCKVILDYGHNMEGYKAVLSCVKKFDYKRLIGIIGVPGDRLDANIINVGKIAGDYLDFVYVKEDIDKRGRESGEVTKLLREGLYKSEISKSNIKTVLDEKEALRFAIGSAKPGDIIIVFYELLKPLLDIVGENIKCDKIEKDQAFIAY
ncbi:MAG TPA: cyanophycin synthetase [Clostridiaceae bacterium]